MSQSELDLVVLTRPNPTFLGFRVKRITPRPDWIAAPQVDEVCSVSDCVANPPKDWVKRWDFNSAACYVTEELAVATIEPCHESEYKRYAYEMFPLEFDAGKPAPSPVEEFFGAKLGEFPTGPLPLGYQFLGYDAVSGCRFGPAAAGFAPVNARLDCSPLSCNNLAADWRANRFCLIDDWDVVAAAATRFSLEQPEPGPYYILAVYRKENT